MILRALDGLAAGPALGKRAGSLARPVRRRALAVARDCVEAGWRRKPRIPFNPMRVALQYDHSMEQGLPPSILRTSSP